MISLKSLALGLAAGVLLWPGIAAAQATDVPGFENVVAKTWELLPGDHFRFTGDVEMSQKDMRFYADQVDYFGDTDRLLAVGNVLAIQSDHQIAADKADFNAKTRLGTFFNARGFAALGAQGDKSSFGTLQPDVQFYGDTIEKIGDDTYLITHGGFTTCAQANPRWEVTSGTLRLRIDHYAFMRNSLLKAKGVPVLYLPVMYYPLSKDNRSTGFLMPTYGSSTVKGQTLSNGFFWAINRSQDATIQHDWYSKTGQAMSGEYRYVSLGGGGNLRTEFLNEHPVSVTSDGVESIRLGQKSFRLDGSLSQALGHGWYSQGRANYSSDLTVDQIYATDIARASNRTRFLGGSVSGGLAGYRITGTYDRNEYFQEDGSSSLRGNSPRVNVSRPDRALAFLPVYYSATSDYVHLVSQGFDADHTQTRKEDIDRLDVVPVIRFPYTRLSFLSLNTSLTWRNTWWSDSNELINGSYVRTTDPLSRRFFEMSADISGPTLVRIWDAPDSKYAQRFKHTIEPFLRVTHRTSISNTARIIPNDYTDQIVGDTTEYAYGTNSRLYAKKTSAGLGVAPREIVAVTIRQTYYTVADAAQTDPSNVGGTTSAPTKFSPVFVTVRTSPTDHILGTFRTELDARYHKFRQFGADGSWTIPRLTLLAGWSQFRYNADATGQNNAPKSHYFNSDLTMRFKQNRYGLIHSFNWDIQAGSILQQRIAAYYNAQCCGFTAEYQTFDLSRYSGPVPAQKDSRFHFSITLAGIGNVSNIFGGLGGAPNR